MAEISKNPKLTLRWTKKDICMILGCDYRQFKHFLNEETKTKYGIRKGEQYFNDVEALGIIKSFRGLATDEEIRSMLYPKGLF